MPAHQISFDYRMEAAGEAHMNLGARLEPNMEVEAC